MHTPGQVQGRSGFAGKCGYLRGGLSLRESRYYKIYISKKPPRKYPHIPALGVYSRNSERAHLGMRIGAGGEVQAVDRLPFLASEILPYGLGFLGHVCQC